MQILIRSYREGRKLWAIGAIQALTESRLSAGEAEAFVENLPRVLEVTDQEKARWPLRVAALLDENGVDGEILPESSLVSLMRLNAAQASADAATCRERFIRGIAFLPDGTTAAQIIALLA